VRSTYERILGAILAFIGFAVTAWQWYGILSTSGVFFLLGLNFWGTLLCVFGLDRLLLPRTEGFTRIFIRLSALACAFANYYASVLVLRDKLSGNG
jgi:hypothetical protein